MKCPVCNVIIDNTVKECSNCGFDQLHKEFINDSDYAVWLRETVEPCKKIYNYFYNTPYDVNIPTGGVLHIPKDKVVEHCQGSLKRIQELHQKNKELEEKHARLVAQSIISENNISGSQSKVQLGANDVIFEDDWLVVKFLKWEQVYYINSGDTRVATFLFENKSSHKLEICFKNISVDGFLNQEKSLTYSITANQKGINPFNFIYENKVPGNLEDFDSVDFQLYYQTTTTNLPWCNSKKITLKL